MIPRADIVEWGRRVGWPTDEQIEQDLLLSRLIVEIGNDPYLDTELVFRGGTCLHKLHTNRAYGYSEDLDYVRRTGGGIAALTRALTAVGERLGMDVRTQIGPQPKVYLRAPFESGTGRMRIKIEMNTFERSPVRDLVRITYAVESAWFAGSADVVTFSAAELISTKLRALFQRSKGRDLFDLWLAPYSSAFAPTISSSASRRTGLTDTRAAAQSRTCAPSSPTSPSATTSCRSSRYGRRATTSTPPPTS